MHAMFGMTAYQNVSGLRSSTDFAELPSTLMEFFSQDFRVVSTFAFHHASGEPLPRALFDVIAARRTPYPALATEHSIVHAQLDLDFHAEGPFVDA